ncbi:cytochrome b/b6 domain-containing protein, partial [Pseudomonas syringae pv. tagetis]
FNAVLRLLYWLVLYMGVLVVLSGLAIWNPVMFQGLVSLMGGFDFARWVLFGAMAAIGALVVVNLVLGVLVPSTLLP